MKIELVIVIGCGSNEHRRCILRNGRIAEEGDHWINRCWKSRSLFRRRIGFGDSGRERSSAENPIRPMRLVFSPYSAACARTYFTAAFASAIWSWTIGSVSFMNLAMSSFFPHTPHRDYSSGDVSNDISGQRPWYLFIEPLGDIITFVFIEKENDTHRRDKPRPTLLPQTPVKPVG